MLSVLVALGLVVSAVLLDRVWLWARAQRANAYTLLRAESERQLVSDIAARTRRAEEQMRRVAFRGWLR
jgi:hypothetical protein